MLFSGFHWTSPTLRMGSWNGIVSRELHSLSGVEPGGARDVMLKLGE